MTDISDSSPFGYGLSADLAIQSLPRFSQQFTFITHAELAWHLNRLSAGSLRHPLLRAMPPLARGCVVRWASHSAVTSTACHRRLLVVAYKVMANSVVRISMTRQSRACALECSFLFLHVRTDPVRSVLVEVSMPCAFGRQQLFQVEHNRDHGEPWSAFASAM